MSRPARSLTVSRPFFARLETAVRRVGLPVRPPYVVHVSTAAARVRLMPSPRRPPASATERQAFDVVHREGMVSLDALTWDVAGRLYIAEIQRGGWVATVEHFGPHTYLPGVARVIQEGDGVLWHVEPMDALGAAEAPASHPLHLEGARS